MVSYNVPKNAESDIFFNTPVGAAPADAYVRKQASFACLDFSHTASSLDIESFKHQDKNESQSQGEPNIV